MKTLHVSFWTMHEGRMCPPGEEIEVDDDQAAMLIRDGKCRLAGTPEPGSPEAVAQEQGEEPAAAQPLAATAEPERPGRGATREEWAEYAAARGMPAEEAAGKSRAALVAAFAGS